MNQQAQPSLQNSFIAGLKTEYTGLNFPENACTDTQNTFFSLIGDVTRREGYNYEANNTTTTINRSGLGMSSYRWLNAGGDGLTQILVQQVGSILYFYKSSAATIAAPLSTTKLASTVDVSTFVASGGSFDATIECQYATGNGYLFVFHPSSDSFYCTFSSGVVAANIININIRDFTGILEVGVADNFRPVSLTNDHHYNLYNQGWRGGSGAYAYSSSSSVLAGTGSKVFNIGAAFTGTNGDFVTITSPGTVGLMTGTVTSYANPNLTINVTGSTLPHVTLSTWIITHNSDALINGFLAATSTTYPSNSDVWWYFKDSTGIYNPSSTLGSVTIGGPAPKGNTIFSLFNQDRSTLSGFTGITPVTTTVRPKTGAWYQGRVWYAGVDSTFPASGDAQFYNWSETIYFSQIVERIDQFANCYQTNDPTSENLFNLLPSDGGTIVIPGAGSIYKLFPLKFGLLVLAANGIWYISGSSGIGFSATDYTITKISSIQSVSGTSVIDVQGFPMFWNNEGIYYVTPTQQGAGSAHSPDIALDVNNICLGTILTYYQNIPLQSIKFSRGDYHQLDYVVQWCFRSTNESSVTDRYQYDTILNYNIITKAFFPYVVETGSLPYIHDIKYIQNPGGTGNPFPVFKYWNSISSAGSYNFTYAEERDATYVDWAAVNPTNYVSYFVTGYSLKGQALRKFQVPYLWMYSRNMATNGYIIEAEWDFASSGNSGKWSTRQVINNSLTNFSMLYRRHRLRGRGQAMQIRVTSRSGLPFDFMGWAVFNEINTGV